jgi:hypothetical protein
MSTEMTTTPSRGLALASFEDAFRFAKMVAASDFAPKDFRGKPESCLLAIQHGSEIGLSPMQSLQNIACINGRPAIWGDAALALCLASPVCDGIHETIEGDGDNMTAVCNTSRKGKDANVVSRFSVADAKKAGLWGKTGPWSAYPRRMLQLRARGFALRDAFPDVLKGLVTAEEAQDYATAATAPEPKPAAAGITVTHPQRFSSTPSDADEERADPFTVAQNAIEAERDIVKLDAMRSRVDARMKDKTFSPGQADDLLDFIHARIEFLESESEVTA